jgi:hypothetical protein
VKLTNSLIITLIGLVCLTALGLRNDMDVSMAISGVVLSYVGSRGALKGTGMIAASRDPEVDTLKAIEKLKG